MHNTKNFKSLPWQQWSELLGRALALAFLIVASVVMAILPFQTQHWYSKVPFIGALVENEAVLVSAGPIQAGAWSAHAQGASYGQSIQTVNGEKIEKRGDLIRLLQKYQVGDSVALAVELSDGSAKIYQVTLQQMPLVDLVSYFIAPYLIALIYLITGIWVFGFRRRDATGRTYAAFTAAVTLALSTLFDNYTLHTFTYFWIFGLCILGGALVNMALFFPEEEGSFLQKYSSLSWLAYLPGLVIFAIAVPMQFDFDRLRDYAQPWAFTYLYTGLGFLAFLGSMFYRSRRSSSPVVAGQSRMILIGAALGFSLIVGYMIANMYVIITGNQTQIIFTPLLLLPLIIFAGVTSYSIARYRLLQADQVVTLLVIYGSLTFLAAAGYALIVTGLTLLVGNAFALNNPYTIGLIVFILAFFLQPLRERIQVYVNTVMGRGQAQFRERVQNFSHELTQALDTDAIVNLIREFVQEALQPHQVHVFLYDILTDQYVAAKDETDRPSSDLYFLPNSSLVKTLSSQQTSLFLVENNTIPVSLRADQARLSLLGAQLYVPMRGRERLVGWVSLAPRRFGEAYNSRDLSYVEALADQSALALERAQVVTDLERRVHAMNVLTRISQGINVTVAFDDILELIYAQTYQVIKTRDVRITLQDSYSNVLYHVFFLEDDERLNERENQPISFNQGLEREIIRLRRPISTEDYERECRGRGVLPGAKGLYAWIGVPLNTGKETIGVLSLGSRDASVIYTEEQVNLLQAIADQAAGAIVKSRLLEEAERRARQLTTLNEVARSLSSTLELAPLFNQILKSAVDILNCGAGSLLLRDQQTDEMVFEAAVGPVAANLIGQRLPPGKGLVGKAVETRQPIIVNDVRRTKDWFEKTDEESGFTTNDMLVVPMIFKDEVTGVVEVLNRQDGLPFTPDDQELLMAFSSQAAVALENARLYTLTDQTLAERVEELSMMQRIDRELNESLDVNRAMRLTLDWAMRQSHANAGLVGMLEEDKVRIMAHQGYTNELEIFQDGMLPTNLPAIQMAIQTSSSQVVRADGGGTTPVILRGAREQTVIPIRRESAAIGLLLMESKSAGSTAEETITFLTRLMDHASIAIANARLYDEVQEANRAKSDFISFVSHELKTPMTSIRGFTDLLSAGVVGPVNENQSNFLGTIRSNVDRMATLVTDLADVARIEAGRLRMDFAPIKVAEVVEEVTRSLRQQIETKQQKLHINIPEDLPPMWGDKMRLIQVITNLISNAYKYSPPEAEIFLQAEQAENIWGEGAPNVIHFYVRDTGFGISPENQKKIFQKFYRADDQKVRDAPGTGLGLNITKQLVELQGGQIWFESEFRVGTTFHIIIPIAETA